MNMSLGEKRMNYSIGVSPFNLASYCLFSPCSSVPKPRLHAPVPIRPVASKAASNAEVPKIGFSSGSPSSQLGQFRNVLKESLNPEWQGETNATFTPTMAQRKVSEVSLLTHGDTSAFQPLGEEPKLKKMQSSPDEKKQIDLTQSVNPVGTEEKEPLKRWNRNDDRYLWKVIRDVARESNTDLEEVLRCISHNDQSSYWNKILPVFKAQVESYSESQTLEQVDKKGMKFFIKRVIKLSKMRKVSRREHKLIRKLLRSNKEGGPVDWESILFNFPGKRIGELKNYTFENFPKYFQGEGNELDGTFSDDNRSQKSTEVQN